MTASMTGFARLIEQGEWGSATWEIRSLNHRYLDVSIRMPEVLRGLEPSLRKIISQYASRGKIECFLRYQPGATQLNQLRLNHNLLNQLQQLYQEICQSVQATQPINPMQLMSWQDVVQTQQVDNTELNQTITQLFTRAMQELQQVRQREGEQLASFVENRVTQLTGLQQQVQARLPQALQNQRDKLLAKIKQADITLDEGRLEQEMLLFAQKTDVAEELERLTAHRQEVLQALASSQPVGRRLDFLMQELSREINTLGVKTPDVEISKLSVDMKVIIEQMREQVQNIE
jgi:uncharacterized protein (TIGR00255 family)